MHVARTTFFPVLVGAGDPRLSAAHVIEEFVGDLGVGYISGPPFGRTLLTWDDVDNSGASRRRLRREAAANLNAALGRVAIHGQPPALMLSFGGLESSVLLAHAFWGWVEQSVPGDLVVGVPARDVVIFTGLASPAGMEKVRRAVDRVLYAGGRHLLTRDLLVRREGRWEVYRPERSWVPPPRAPRSTVRTR